MSLRWAAGKDSSTSSARPHQSRQQDGCVHASQDAGEWAAEKDTAASVSEACRKSRQKPTTGQAKIAKIAKAGRHSTANAHVYACKPARKHGNTSQ